MLQESHKRADAARRAGGFFVFGREERCRKIRRLIIFL